MAEITCSDLGYYAGQLACSPNCRFDTSGCLRYERDGSLGTCAMVSSDWFSPCFTDPEILSFGSIAFESAATREVSLFNKSATIPLIVSNVFVSQRTGLGDHYSIDLSLFRWLTEPTEGYSEYPPPDFESAPLVLYKDGATARPDVLLVHVTALGRTDGPLPAEALIIVTNDASETQHEIPFDGLVVGCPPGKLDLNDDPLDGCEYVCPVWPPVAEQCNHLDDDCDGEVDEDFDKSTDSQNCGYCGHACSLPNASSHCQNSICVLTACESSPTEGWANANGDPSDGCEYSCPVWPTAIETCNGLDDDCDGLVDERFDFIRDPSHCGGCNQRCSDIHPNSQVDCVNSVCIMFVCYSGYSDLDPEIPGCEYACPVWPTISEVCNELDDDCDGLIDEGYDLLNDPLNCGACGVVVGPGQICCAGVPTGSDESNCGQCGRSCPVGVSCFGGSCIEPGIIVITELQINPEAVADSLGEWLEIFNTTGYDINLRGWVLKDDGADSHTISDDVIVPSLGYAVLGLNSDYSSNGGVSIDYQYSSFNLANSDGDEVVLLAGGQEVDRVVFPGTFDVAGKSKELSRNHIDDLANDTLTNWCTAENQLPSGDYGTPGWANDCAL
jgi:hypothetical protein